MKERLHAVYCTPRRHWLRYRTHLPLWRDDKVAQMLGIAQYGCPRCGRGAAQQMDAARGGDTP